MVDMSILKTVKQLLKAKTHFIVEGVNFISQIPKFHEVFAILIDETKKDELPLYAGEGFNVIFLSNSNFKKISQTVNSQGVLAVCKRPALTRKEGDFYLVLDQIKDPGNMGSIIRTAESAGVCSVFLSKDCVDIYNPKVLRSTMGAIFTMPIFYLDILEEVITLKNEGFKIVATSLKTEKMYYEEELNNKIVVIIGSEANGVSEEILKESTSLVKIPMIGFSESLNASVACGILLYDVIRQRNKK